MGAKRPKLAVFKFASCDGCQLTLLDMEEELLTLAGALDIAYFPEASRKMTKGKYDIGLAEGSITTPGDVERVREIRKSCKILVTIGACATAGGIQALRNWADMKDYLRIVYPQPEFLSILDRSMPIGSFVHVDFELRGCPVSKKQLLETVTAFVHKRRPVFRTHSVCLDCKIRGNLCLPVAKGIPCLGPVTQTGCDALCPRYGRGCFGCFGPIELPNTRSAAARMEELGKSRREIMLAFRGFNAFAEPFRKESDAYEL